MDPGLFVYPGLPVDTELRYDPFSGLEFSLPFGYFCQKRKWKEEKWGKEMQKTRTVIGTFTRRPVKFVQKLTKKDEEILCAREECIKTLLQIRERYENIKVATQASKNHLCLSMGIVPSQKEFTNKELVDLKRSENVTISSQTSYYLQMTQLLNETKFELEDAEAHMTKFQEGSKSLQNYEKKCAEIRDRYHSYKQSIIEGGFSHLTSSSAIMAVIINIDPKLIEYLSAAYKAYDDKVRQSPHKIIDRTMAMKIIKDLYYMLQITLENEILSKVFNYREFISSFYEYLRYLYS
jgi:hypothetical protein